MSPASMTVNARDSSEVGRTEPPDTEEAAEADTLFRSTAEDEFLHAHVFFVETHLAHNAVAD